MRSNSLSPSNLWRIVAEQLRSTIDPAAFDSWLAGAVGVSFEHETFTIGVQTKYVKSMVERRFRYNIQEVLRSLLGMSIDVYLVVLERDSQGLSVIEEQEENILPVADNHEMPSGSTAGSLTRYQQKQQEETETLRNASGEIRMEEGKQSEQFYLTLDHQGDLRSMTFDTLDEEQMGIQDAVIAALEFVLSPWGTLFIVGPPVCGKTHLSAATMWGCLEQGHCRRAFFAQTKELFSLLQSSFGTDGTGHHDILLDQIREVDLLVIENLMHPPRIGGSVTWFDQVLYRCLAYRLDTGKMTIVTARPESLLTLDQRLLSRLSDPSIVRTAIIHQ